MVKFWFKVAMIAACLAAVIIAKIHLSELAGSGATPQDWTNRNHGGLEVETQATQGSGKPSGH